MNKYRVKFHFSFNTNHLFRYLRISNNVFCTCRLLDLEHADITRTLVSQLKGIKHSLKKMTFKGAQVLVQKIDEAKIAV